MGYDVGFWDAQPKCKFNGHAIYRRLRRGLPIKGLRAIPRRKAERVIRELLDDCEQDGERFEGRLEGSHVEISLKNDAILANFSMTDVHFPEILSAAFAELGVSIYDPLAVRAPSGDYLYDEDYAEVSHDPDLGYWVEVDLTGNSSHQIVDRVPLGAQVVNEIEYVFFRVTEGTDVSELYNAIASGNASIPPDRLNGGSLDGYATVAVVVVVPAALVQRHSAGYEPREHIRLFTAFADNEKVLHYQQWWPNDAGVCATVISLRAMPKRMKTLLSTRFAHRG